MRPLSSWLSSLTGRLMLAFCLLALLLLLLVTLGNLSLYWVKGADSFLYEKALPASEAARQLSQSATSLAENAQRLAQLPMKSSVNIWGVACLLRAIACWRRLRPWSSWRCRIRPI